MALLATQTCIEIRQEIGWTEKRTIETSFEMKLFDDQLTVKNDHYPLTAIFDISYRKKPGKDTMGFLYLHTNRGVRTYYIKDDAYTLVTAYKKLKSERPELR
ncbi:hypothetical protein JCM9140_2795 [Halalkalibacter wakoensis JCM 9140]|uniref:Uncharacterized protein n=1 Tax=Halalkalibacter wakoensis JCM 9140 TaxID=1236970 RepID=W4Q3P5_9BACI|nr:hypothetical protein [Halalkalibacter wakoensis]GAE26706.1 hypothetical protein JCM9140_2795 [Halalkalibacter wakoensis JCM 9140]